MKNLIVFICSMVLLSWVNPVSAMLPEEESPGETIRILYSPDLENVARASAEAFMRSNEGLRVTTKLIGDENLDAWIRNPGHIVFVTKEFMKGIDSRQARINVVGREVYVPVMHAENPFRDEILKQGISPAEFARIYCEEAGSWGAVLNNGSKAALHPYRASDPYLTSYLCSFTEQDPAEIGGNVLGSCGEVIGVVQKEKGAIGFCTLSQLRDLEESQGTSGLTMIPVDLNENNRVDHFEQIFGSVDELSRGIWIGKYTGTLYSRIFAVTYTGNPAGSEVKLIRWMTTEGQELLAAHGYSTLIESERVAMLAGLDNQPFDTGTAERSEANASFWLLLVTIILAGGILVTIVLMVFNKREAVLEKRAPKAYEKFMAETTGVPGGYFFDRSHTWTYLEKDGKIRVGVDSFLQKVTGTITKVEMKVAGEKVKKGETVMALIQNGKRLQLKSPVSGIIREKNDKLQSQSSLVNSSPFSDGWVYLVEPTNWMEEFRTFLTGQKYSDWIGSELARLRDFFAASGKAEVVLQEGGEVADAVLSGMGPEVWEDFQTGFLKN
ncbi:MAG: hypothetical protein WD052_13370 [Bacteroidales bacterium]